MEEDDEGFPRDGDRYFVTFAGKETHDDVLFGGLFGEVSGKDFEPASDEGREAAEKGVVLKEAEALEAGRKHAIL